MGEAGEPGEMRRGVRLGVDVGAVRIGVSRCDPHGLLATPWTTVTRTKKDDGVSTIAGMVAEAGVIEVVVGLPLHMSGQEGAAGKAARAYACDLAAIIAPTPVRLVDERLSTVSAHAHLHRAGKPGRAHREVVDQVAATVILQSALDAERTAGDPPGELVKVCAEPTGAKESRT